MLPYGALARQEWDQARRKAFWKRMVAELRGKNVGLLDFNEISRRLHLTNAIYRGAQNVPLDKIVGSVGRYQDFTAAFLPLSEDMRSRWQRIAALYLDAHSGGVPPIEVYKVGDAYFVKDGNHRVSVAHQLDMDTIEAYVWEYPQPVAGLDAKTDIDTLLLEAERSAFLAQTKLDQLRPDHDLRLTAPGGYPDMLGQIAHYQDVLSRIDGVETPYEEAVTAWYDMLYETAVQVFEKAGVLKQFPDRTPADFFVWIMRHHDWLEARYGRRVMLGDAARDFRQGKTWPGRLWRALLRRLKGPSA